MRAWEDRPVEVANLLNPAFCGEVFRCCIKEYVRQRSRSFPYPLLYLVLPIVLHRKTRGSIADRELRQLHVWLQENQDARIGFAERARELVPITNEALAFLLQIDAAMIDSQMGIVLPRRKHSEISEQVQGEVADCYKKAVIVGRWFSRAGSLETIYTMWGVKP